MIPEGLVLALDTASDVAGVALFQGEALLGEVTWRTRQNHSRELLPALDWLLGHAARPKEDIAAVCVCTGPGSYAGLRVGLSTAKALAYALGVPLAGAGRLAAEALPYAEATGSRVFAVQAAGRAELAWAVYRQVGAELAELEAPHLSRAEVLLAAVEPGDLLCGDVDKLDGDTCTVLDDRGCRLLAAAPARVVAVGRLGLRRLAHGDIDNPDTLVPLYLRAPAIGPQPPR